MAVVNVTGPYRTGFGSSASDGGGYIESGKGIVIGDGVWLTAAHVVYEWDRVSATNPNIIANSSLSSKIVDYRGYKQGYMAAVTAAANSSAPNPPIENELIEGKLGLKDSIVLTGQSGTSTSSSEGLALFYNPSDLVSNNMALALNDAGVSVKRLAMSTQSGTIDSAGNGSLLFSAISAKGDSGGAYVLSSGGKSFVIGTHAGNQGAGASAKAFGTYFNKAEWAQLNGIVTAGKTGDITSSEPTNIVVGTNSDDGTLVGSLRADIILGRGGADVLDGGDTASIAWGNDQLFGGLGDDRILAGLGNDLMHGGDRSVSTTKTDLFGDGNDTADYSGVSAGGLPKGIEVIVGKVESSLYASNPDFASAIFVKDLSRQSGTSAPVDTLISIEDVLGTARDDRLVINSFNGSAIANAQGKGGLHVFDGGGHGNGGDTVDLSGLANGAAVRLGFASSSFSAIADPTRAIVAKNFENVIASQQNDTITLTDSTWDGIIDGKGGDDTLSLASVAGATYNVNTAPTVKFGLGSGHDTLIGSTTDDYLAQPSGGNGWTHWNVDKVDLSTLQSSDVTIIWDFVVEQTFPSQTPDQSAYGVQGDLWIKLNGTGESLFFGQVAGSQNGSDGGSHSSDLTKYNTKANLPTLAFSDKVLDSILSNELRFESGRLDNAQRSSDHASSDNGAVEMLVMHKPDSFILGIDDAANSKSWADVSGGFSGDDIWLVNAHPLLEDIPQMFGIVA